jgi:hypothetical protein
MDIIQAGVSSCFCLNSKAVTSCKSWIPKVLWARLYTCLMYHSELLGAGSSHRLTVGKEEAWACTRKHTSLGCLGEMKKQQRNLRKIGCVWEENPGRQKIA